MAKNTRVEEFKMAVEEYRDAVVEEYCSSSRDFTLGKDPREVARDKCVELGKKAKAAEKGYYLEALYGVMTESNEDGRLQSWLVELAIGLGREMRA